MRPPADLSVPSSGRHAADDAWLDYAGPGQGNYDFGTHSRAAHAAGPGGRAGGGHGRAAGAGAGGGAGRARIREAPFGSAPVESIALVQEALPQARPAAPSRPAAPREPWYQVVGPAPAARSVPGQARPLGLDGVGNVNGVDAGPPLAQEAPRAQRLPDLPFAAPHARGVYRADGRTNCGPIERILWRQWDETHPPPPQAMAAVERLASLPQALQEKLADGLDGIYVGAGGVPELDHMTELRGVPLPSGRATWDACAGAYGERKIVVGTRPSPTPDVMCHEIGHALDDLDSPPGKWQSDSSVFRLIYDECQPYIASDFHRQRGGLGRKEFFADAFAAIASGQRPALVDMLGGNTRCALKVMLYFNRRYGI